MMLPEPHTVTVSTFSCLLWEKNQPELSHTHQRLWYSQPWLPKPLRTHFTHLGLCYFQQKCPWSITRCVFVAEPELVTPPCHRCPPAQVYRRDWALSLAHPLGDASHMASKITAGNTQPRRVNRGHCICCNSEMLLQDKEILQHSFRSWIYCIKLKQQQKKKPLRFMAPSEWPGVKSTLWPGITQGSHATGTSSWMEFFWNNKCWD